MNYNFICKKCYDIPLIEFDSFNKINVTCGCCDIRKIDIYNFFNIFLIKKDGIIRENNTR